MVAYLLRDIEEGINSVCRQPLNVVFHRRCVGWRIVSVHTRINHFSYGCRLFESQILGALCMGAGIVTGLNTPFQNLYYLEMNVVVNRM